MMKLLRYFLFIALLMFSFSCGNSLNDLDDGSNAPIDDDTGKSEIPVFSPMPGNFDSDQNVAIITTTQDAIIYYTTDNSDPSTGSDIYSAPIPVAGNATSVTIKAIAVKSGTENSDVATGTFTINYNQAASPQISPAAGTFYHNQQITISCATDSSIIRYTTDNSAPSETNGKVITNGNSFTLGTSATVKAIAYKAGMTTSSIAGTTYTFKCIPPVFSPMPGSYGSDQNITLSKTTPDAIIYYTIDNSDPSTDSDEYNSPISVTGTTINITSVTIKAIVVKTGLDNSDIASGTFIVDYNQVTSPQISPDPGIFLTEQAITITCITDGATIRYTTDNSTPSQSNGTIITSGGSFTLSSSAPVKAIAYKTSMVDSAISRSDYVFRYWEWTWVSGDNTHSQTGIYGTKGTGSTDNKPGARYDGVSWIDSSGNLWLFGGRGYDSSGVGYLNDLWKFEPSTGKWTWVSGDNTVNQSGVYGTKGTGSTSNKPGARACSVSWIDASGNLWLFGGFSSGTYISYEYNDLWKFEPSTRRWTWVSGDNTSNQKGVYGTKGTGSTSNKPGARRANVSWIDSSGNLWLFGGYGYDASSLTIEFLNDLWKFEPSTGRWTWVSGDNTAKQCGVYGTKGTGSTSNKPGARDDSISWIDSSGNLWLFGGSGYNSSTVSDLNDLWKFEPSTGKWTWVSGLSSWYATASYDIEGRGNVSYDPGSRSKSISWIDSSGNLWLYGGYAYYNNPGGAVYGYLNDLWKFEPSTGKWTWVSGDSAFNQPGVYGTKGAGSAYNKPGAREDSISWRDSSGNLWLFGGAGWGYFNDLWKFKP